jgi:hypothetical protein
MTDNQGNKASNAMELISQLECKVRDKNERIKELEKAVMYKVTKSELFWVGMGVGMLGTIVVDLIVRLVIHGH